MNDYQSLLPDTDVLLDLIGQHYSLAPEALHPLDGEVDFNFRLREKSGTQWLVKLSRTKFDEKNIAFQLAMARHLAAQQLSFVVPRPLPTKGGDDYLIVSLNGQRRLLRLQHWVAGKVLGDVQPRSGELRESWGRVAGELSRALANFQHPDAPSFHHWTPSATLHSRAYAQHFRNDQEREIADHFWKLFTERTEPLLSQLRKSINYNDAHEHNLLVDGPVESPRINGVIDFGDAVFTETVNELAIACAYAGMYVPDPLAAITEVVAAYHRTFPLLETEIRALLPLITGRLLITVSRAALNRSEEPDNEYLSIHEVPAWELLNRLRHISPVLVEATFRVACGFSPIAKTDFWSWTKRHRAELNPVIPLDDQQPVALDFKVASLSLGSYADYGSRKTFALTVERMITEQDGTMGIGGYGETRPFYTTDAYRTEGNNGPQWRTTHLGYDLWMAAGTPVSAPWDAYVHSFTYDPADRSYGTCIILAHRPKDHPPFYTLYGHLGRDSIKGLKEGQFIPGGTTFASIGAYEDNGGWPPHLHFQVMLDTLGMRGDFPGVAYPSEAAVWLGICPDPRYLFPQLATALSTTEDATPSPTEAFDSVKVELLGRRKKSLGYSLSISYDHPLHMVRGQGQYLLDPSGRRYLDTVNNVAHVGHEHPAVVRAGQRQMAVLNTNTRYLHEEVIAFAEELTATLPSPLSVVHFVNSGSEANELALRMIEAVTGSRRIIALEVGYHGNTGRTVDLSHYKFAGKGGKGQADHVEIIPMPDVFRGPHRDPSTAGAEYAAYVGPAIDRIRASGHKVGGFLAESILSCGGQIVPPSGYLSAVYEQVRKAGGVCVADEVQVGMGRVGSHWWGFELQGVVPDIITIGKPIGNGHPLGAVVCTPAVAEAFANGMEYFNTFGGNPVSSAIGRAVLRTVRNEDLRQRATTVGTTLINGLRELSREFPIIGDVRGHGLFLGFELVDDPVGRTPATRRAAYLKNRMRQLGFLMSTDGPDENVLKIKPPLCITTENAEDLLTYLRRVLGEDPMRV